jgi:hypothetical protein
MVDIALESHSHYECRFREQEPFVRDADLNEAAGAADTALA